MNMRSEVRSQRSEIGSQRSEVGRIRNYIIEHINNNAKDYFIILIMFVIGIVLGVFVINNSSEEQKNEVTSYIDSFINTFKNNNSIDYLGLIKYSIIKYISIACILWFLGIAVTLVPLIYGVIIFKGFCLGYTISSAIAILGIWKGLLFAVTLLLLQNILIIPVIFAIALSGIKLHNNILKTNKNEEQRFKIRKERSNLKIELLRHSLLSLIMSIILIISSFIEVYASTNFFNFVVQFI